ncbi:MAG: TlpA family protein disulfide reductase [Alphaproteobacteria bacterium]|nr:TlpA family protein disulfide reductase [Alphaproteobacteria bacterium]HPF46485.1 TlpA disulfide reductase family protein [Emcibacteraceae bacterium]
MRLLISILLFVFATNAVYAEDIVGNLNIGDAIPDALGSDIDGTKINSSDYQGKIMVISFWATWCPPCRRELPIIDNLQRLVGKDRLAVIAVNFGESKRIFRKFIRAAGDVHLTFSHDNKGKIGTKTFGIKAIPHMIIVDHMGKVAHVHSGYGEETVDNLANEINGLLSKM